MQAKTLPTEHGDIAYWVSPVVGARTLVFLHGLTADHTLFEKQLAAFEHTYSLLAWDAPAHGQSRPYDTFRYGLATECLKAILDRESITHAVLIGQSMGGFIAQDFISKYPQYVDAFIGIDTCPFGERYYSKSDRWWLERVEPLARLYPLNVMRWAIAKQCACTPYARQNMRDILNGYSKDELCRLMGLAFGGFIAANHDMAITCPTLILVGRLDHTGKVQAYCKAWHEHTGFPLVVIDHASHNANADQPEIVNAQVERFVEALDGQ